jgi:hypothetical protein
MFASTHTPTFFCNILLKLKIPNEIGQIGCVFVKVPSTILTTDKNKTRDQNNHFFLRPAMLQN